MSSFYKLYKAKHNLKRNFLQKVILLHTQLYHIYLKYVSFFVNFNITKDELNSVLLF